MSPRVLLVSYAWPPIAAPEAILAAKAARSLGTQGVEVDVLATFPAPWQRLDPSLVAYAERAAGETMRVRVPRWVPLVQPTPWTRRFPDAMRFVRRAALAALSTHDLTRYDALLTWSQWHSAHLVGLDLKRRHPHLRWTAHFSDPWMANPLQPKRGLAARVNRRMEQAVVETADVLEFTTEDTRMLTTSPYQRPAESHVIPHPYDPDLYPELSERRTDAIVIRHIGNFYAQRTPLSLVEALSALHRRRPDLTVGVCVELIGDMPTDVLARVRAVPLPRGLLITRPPVEYTTSLGLMRTSDLLVSIDAPATRSVFLPSKLADYVGAGRPILTLSPPGPARHLVETLGGWAADPADVPGISAALESSIAQVRRPWLVARTAHDLDITTIGSQRRRFVLGV